MTSVSIIIPAFNAAALTARCLQALERQDFEVIVVDDGSTDETGQCLALFGDHIRVVTHPTNQGFALSCNDGAAVSSGEYLVFLNNDTLPEPGWLEALVQYADTHPRASVVGAQLLYPDHTVQHAGVVICQDRYPRHIYAGFPAGHPAVSKSRRFQIVTAACMLIRRRVFQEAQGFDANYRNGFEDVDLCLRLGEAGHEIHYCAESVVQHFESVSPGRFKHDPQNVALYRRRWLPQVQPDDVHYYLEDGLLRFTYEGAFPLRLEVSPRLACVQSGSLAPETERLLAEQARHIADLRRENALYSTRLAREFPASETAKYEQLRSRIRLAVEASTRPGATVLVVSKGDRMLLQLNGREGRHFPQTATGAYAGHHPSDSAEAIAHVEALRARGADYLVLPQTAFWWLEHYRELARHLTTHHTLVAHDPETCLIFELRPRCQDPAEAVNAHRSAAVPTPALTAGELVPAKEGRIDLCPPK